MLNRYLVVVFFLLSYGFGYAQKTKKPKVNLPQQPSHSNIGFGTGLDYGGFGLKVGLLSFHSIELFGGIGYNLLEIAGNAGLTFKILPNSKFCPYVSGMYGYNAVYVSSVSGSGPIKYKSGDTYYGISASGGVRVALTEKVFINVGVVLPFRSDDALKDDKKYSPVLVSFGLHFSIPNL